jgi:AraC-like DNA-binding protein
MNTNLLATPWEARRAAASADDGRDLPEIIGDPDEPAPGGAAETIVPASGCHTVRIYLDGEVIVILLGEASSCSTAAVHASGSAGLSGTRHRVLRDDEATLHVYASSRQASRNPPGVLHQPASRRCALPRWRLARVVEYVDAQLGKTITLAGMAHAAGLTRMHFARQFRAATGVRPHKYVLLRRIERAKTLLRSPGITLIEIAFSVGFQTQAHFSTVFKRLEGETPSQWRRLLETRATSLLETGDQAALIEDPVGIESTCAAINPRA